MGFLDTYFPTLDFPVKNLPAMQEMWVQSPGWEDPLEKGMATHPSILAWRIPWTEEPLGNGSWGRKQLDMTEVTEHVHTASTCIF